jgi:hypothetical protein
MAWVGGVLRRVGVLSKGVNIDDARTGDEP